MRLADCIAQYRTPFVVQDGTGARNLSNVADYADEIANCPFRYVLSDDLTRLCADLAYSKGARTVACADLLHVPARVLWIEWCDEPWQSALRLYGFQPPGDPHHVCGHRGVLVRASPDGRRGLVRTFWCGEGGRELLASSVEGYFDFDTPPGDEPEAPDGQMRERIRVYDAARVGDDVLGQCFRFRYERSWSDYYGSLGLLDVRRRAIWLHALGTIAIDMPLLLAFLLLLATRTGLPQRPQSMQQLNKLRAKVGKAPLLDHIEVRAPLMQESPHVIGRGEACSLRRGPRLHHVRGHLVRRGSQLFWRVPHLRGSARSGVVKTRTVVWTFGDAVREATSTSGNRAGRAATDVDARVAG